MNPEPDNLSIIKTHSLTSVLVRELERLILNGELQPGERLNELKLATRFGTSRGPLREAVRSLEAKGYVQIIRNRGVLVRSVCLEEAREIYDVRSVLFGLAGRLAAERVTDDIIARQRELMDRMDMAAVEEDVDTYYHLNLEFHASILEASENRTLIEDYKRLVTRMHLFRVKGLVQGGGLAVSNKEHAKIVAALASGDPVEAQQAAIEHVEFGKQRVTAAIGSLQSDTGSVHPD